jgi:hypothetical protein
VDALVAHCDLHESRADATVLDLPGQFLDHPAGQFLDARLACPIGPVRRLVDPRRDDHREIRGFGHLPDDVDPPSHPDGGTLDQCRDAGFAGAAQFRRHRLDDRLRIGIALCGGSGRPQVDENVLVWEDQSQVVTAPVAECRGQAHTVPARAGVQKIPQGESGFPTDRTRRWRRATDDGPGRRSVERRPTAPEDRCGRTEDRDTISL